MKTKLKAAVVGVGYLGNFHAQKYKAISQAAGNVDLIGVCDYSWDQAQKIAQSLEVKPFQSAKELIGHVDMVTIAASTQSHYELAKLFLENGVHVNVEKPITATLKQADEIVNLAEKKNLKLAVGHIERFNPSLQELKKNLVKPKYMEMTRHATYKARGADVSVLHDLMIHDIDMMHWLTGSEVSAFHVSGTKLISKEYDTCVGSFEMKNGSLVHIDVSRVSTTMKRGIRTVEDHQIFNVNTGTLEIEKNTAAALVNNQLSENPVEQTKWIVDKKDALYLETEAFIQSVLQNSKPVVTGVDGYRALEVVEKLLQKMN